MDRLNRFSPPLLADAIGAGLLVFFVPSLAQRFAAFSGDNALLVTGAFVIFCVAVSLTKRLRGPGTVLAYKIPLTILAVLLVLLFTWVVMDVWGYLNSVLNLDNSIVNEGEATTYLLVPATWFGFGLVYILVLTTESAPQSADPGTVRFWLLALPGLLGAHLLLLAFTAYGRELWQGAHELAAPAGFLLALLLFTLLLAPARIFYALRTTSLAAYFSFFPLLAVAAWLVIA